MRRIVPSLVILSFALVASPAGSKGNTYTPKAGDAAAESVVKTLDPSVDPCVDFYQFACGGWFQSFELPADKVSYTRSFSSIDERNEVLVKGILEDAAKKVDAKDDDKRIGDLYGSCVDTATIDALGAKPLAPTLAEIAAVKDPTTLMVTLGHLQQVGASPLFGFWVEGDFKDPGVNIMHVVQAGLGLPDRDYYLKEGDDAQKTRDAYVATMEKMLGMAGVAEPSATAKKVYAFELALAKIQKAPEDLRDPTTTYHRIELTGLQAKAPALPFGEMFGAMGVPGLTAINVTDPDYIEGMGKIVAATDYDTLKAYLAWQYITAAAPLLSAEWVDANFAFFRKELVGQKSDRDRWKKCVDTSTEAFGEIIGKGYVNLAFKGESKPVAQDLIGRIAKSFEANLPGLSWMDDATRTHAKEKLDLVNNKIGYPDVWRDYSAVTTDKADFFGNVMRSRAFENKRHLDKVGKPVDKAEWWMTPAEVNAYYDPLKNEIVFPAGILQPPFFDATFPAAMNYGAIGMVMGHEFTHGFDDSGAKFDGHGVMTDWWAKDAVDKFGTQTKCVSDLYGTYTITDGLNVNGELTLGENIADLGGIKQAYGAYQSWKGEHGGTEDTRITGMTADQLFFVGYAQSWCSKRTPEIDQLYATVDPHSPPRFRVNGPLSQLPAFQTAFKCKAGKPMAPKTRCEVW